MSVFRVRVSGDNFINTFDGKDIRCGFVKNEYVWAHDETEAATKAERQIRQKIREHPSMRTLADIEAKIEIEKIESGFSPLRLLQNEGFIFHPAEESS